jgi:uncharacterized membrane protein YoaK (UPF0700 family)
MSDSLLWRSVVETLRPPAGARDGILPPLMLGLTLVTGIVDATAYLKLGHVFVANMTGNVVFLGFAGAGARGLSVIGSLIALGCFLPGGVAAGRLAARFGARPLDQLRTAVALEVGLCSLAVVVAAFGASDPAATSRYVLIGLLSLALGVQNATARRLAVPDLTTTVLTLTLTGIAADSRAGGGSGSATGRRLLAVAAMALGALVGGLLVLRGAPVDALALADLTLAVVLVRALRGARRLSTPAAPAHADGGRDGDSTTVA